MSFSSSFSRDSFIDDSGSLFDSRASSRMSPTASTHAPTSTSVHTSTPLPTPTATLPSVSSTSSVPHTASTPSTSVLPKVVSASSSAMPSSTNTLSESLSTAKEAVSNTLASAKDTVHRGLTSMDSAISKTTNTLTSASTSSVDGVKTFFANHWKTLVVLVVCVLVGILLYLLVTSPTVKAWWNKITTSTSTKTNKMILPRDGTTNVVATKRRKNKYVTKKKNPNIIPPSPQRPDPNPISPNDKEVFNISNNIYTYDDAPAVCKAFNARLATSDEVSGAFKQGADWCNYGWTDGQLALYPTQKATFDKLQKVEGHEYDCGVVGVNGGYFQNPGLQFGVNCYGKKPEPRLQEKELIGYFPDYVSEKEKRMQERVAEIKQNMGDLMITPFNSKSWDKRRTLSEHVEDWMKE